MKSRIKSDISKTDMIRSDLKPYTFGVLQNDAILFSFLYQIEVMCEKV